LTDDPATSAFKTDLPIDIIRVDHVAMATWDASGPARLLIEVLGAEFVDGADEPHNGFRWLQFQLPGGKVEVIEPLNREGFLYRFLTRRGEGLHHVTLYVPDLALAIGQLRGKGYDPVDISLHNDFWKEAFLHPRDTSGVLVQLAQVADPNAKHPLMRPLTEYLADRPNLRPD
jgi:methylmalonyl-CoA/ethylmalonyl-CoA epimerase